MLLRHFAFALGGLWRISLRGRRETATDGLFHLDNYYALIILHPYWMDIR